MRPHISLDVADVKKSIEFYERIFGVKPQKQTDGYAKFDLQSPALNFSMLKAREGESPSRVNHFGIEVESAGEVKQWKERLRKAAVDTVSEDQTDCCYALQDKVWFTDPDGNAWEVFFVHEQLPVEPAQPPKKAKSSCAVPGCC